jgi:hypothetical protein
MSDVTRPDWLYDSNSPFKQAADAAANLERTRQHVAGVLCATLHAGALVTFRCRASRHSYGTWRDVPAGTYERARVQSVSDSTARFYLRRSDGTLDVYSVYDVMLEDILTFTVIFAESESEDAR